MVRYSEEEKDVYIRVWQESCSSHVEFTRRIHRTLPGARVPTDKMVREWVRQRLSGRVRRVGRERLVPVATLCRVLRDLYVQGTLGPNALRDELLKDEECKDKNISPRQLPTSPPPPPPPHPLAAIVMTPSWRSATRGG